MKGPYGDPGEGGLRALQAGSIVMGLPYTFILFWFSQALVQVCREEAGDLDPERPRFKMFLLGAPKSDRVSIRDGLRMTVRNTFAPGFSPAVKKATESWPLGAATNGRCWQVVLQVLWVVIIVMCFLGYIDYSIFMMACALHFVFATWVSLVRREIRRQWNIPRGDFITDYICAVCCWMLVLTQLDIEMMEEAQTQDCPKKDSQEYANALGTGLEPRPETLVETAI